ncbi:YslB family protein [Secundilactobacillus collinoides]|uniref:Hydrocarbon binding protein n=1 Tax=Secundilactobacillus collinoides DSM 20515 = JCM 1123 TaxID=1423733 RepID=A0A0R2BES0_SECCO|nr:YslB family protein [Secundilactobacillus collinoides]KRM74662.1 hypothetical protein FC82_GL003328 [Secundilactobacillus collinoides DSM 20515 = JCM 1123]
MDTQIYTQYLTDPNNAGLFGQALLRDVILTDILGPDASNIAYWEGKQLARRFKIGSANELAIFFSQAQFGTLTLTKQTATQWQFQLTGDPVNMRIASNPKAAFTLEAGFLAESVEQMIGVVAETEVTPVTKTHKSIAVNMTVHLDPKDPTSDPQELIPMKLILPEREPDPETSDVADKN